MSNPIIIETDLKDILVKLDARLERVETKLEVLPKIEAEVTQLKEDVKGIKTKLEVLPKIEAEVYQLKEDVKDLKGRANAQIWALIITVIGATIAAIVRFGFLTQT
ncbi:hypothetical protein [Crocosphaera sp.]|uniref:hypothetical protein n=1 Tax=Crocosphaera sp. TaxID=2729996 RepID=UPI00262AEF16|nr:hypothetical protein [Crocosphaera sp.]MDJ0581538.1 hypothetical protein [Crocosphaera sp.]